jgi:hypothetical protein
MLREKSGRWGGVFPTKNWAWWRRGFAGFFAKNGGQNVVFCMVNVVVAWLHLWKNIALFLVQSGFEAMGSAILSAQCVWKGCEL